MRGSTDVSPSSSSLFAFKPRQVLLLEQRQRSVAQMASQLKPEDESILTFSIALWLENKGFSKVLKRFLSAAQIEDENWKARALNLNEIFSKYQETCKGALEDLKLRKKQEKQVVDTTESNGNANCTESEEKSKKKKKKSKGDAVVTDAVKAPEDTAVSEKMNASYANGNEDQNQKTSDGISDNVQKSKTSKKSNDDEVSELTVNQSTKKQKDKKKNKSKLMSQSLDGDEKQIDVVTESKQKNILFKSLEAELPEKDKETAIDKKSKKRSDEAAEDGIDESKKASKKRKRMASEDNENRSGQEVAVEESKPKKTKGLGEDKNVLPQNVSAGANGNAGKQSKQENFQTGEVGAKQTDGSTKVALNNNGVEKSREPNSARKQQNGSAEPKTVKAFQRVKVEEVKFADDRLQDNSYWAKDGAEIGYGAKAQEVLGQVRGRDFRHEKTKKKRGSYRGGQIDLQTHSIKFNYSDDE